MSLNSNDNKLLNCENNLNYGRINKLKNFESNEFPSFLQNKEFLTNRKIYIFIFHLIRLVKDNIKYEK